MPDAGGGTRGPSKRRKDTSRFFFPGANCVVGAPRTRFVSGVPCLGVPYLAHTKSETATVAPRNHFSEAIRACSVLSASHTGAPHGKYHLVSRECQSFAQQQRSVPTASALYRS